MIGKLIIIGAIVIAVLVFVPGSFKMVTNVILHEVTPDKKQSDSKSPGQTPVDNNQSTSFGGKILNGSNSATLVQASTQTSADNNQSSAQTLQSANSGKISDNSQSLSPTASSSPITPTNYLSSDTSPNLPSSIADYYTVIQLKSTQQGNNILITYDDTSKETISVLVSLKNSEKEIFSGTFASSMFQATVEDVPNSPHIIEMTVQHSVYGTLHGSAYIPAGNSNSTISGIFTKS